MPEIKNEIQCENVMTGNEAMLNTEKLTAAAAKFVVLLSVAIFAPALNMQALTGTLVNATLFIAAVLLGWEGAVLIGVIPSVISATTGLLPAMLLPMIPFIIISNAILVYFFLRFRRDSYWKGVAAASLAKFVFLYVAVILVIEFLAPTRILSQLAAMVTWPQLFTAISGGILANIVLAVIEKSERRN